MRSIKSSKFITIDSGEQKSFINACNKLNEEANVITDRMNTVMPLKLVKVEIISFDRTVTDEVGTPYTFTSMVSNWLNG